MDIGIKCKKPIKLLDQIQGHCTVVVTIDILLEIFLLEIFEYLIPNVYEARSFVLQRHYSCQDSPQIVCSTDRYLTLQLYKERIDAQGYSLLLQVDPKTMKS